MHSARILPALCLAFIASGVLAGEWTEAEKAQIQELRAKLEKSIPIEVADLPVFRALELISRKTGVPITLTGSPQDAIFQQAVNYALESVRGLDLLDVLCRQAGLEYEVLPAIVRVQSAAEFRRQRMKMVSYPLDDLTSAISDFPAPRPGRVFSSGGVNFITPANPWMSSEEIVELIRTIRPESWDAGYGASIQAKQGMVLVLRTEDVHALIRRLFAGLRARAGRQVSFDAWVYAVSSNNMDRLWNDVRTRGGRAPLLDDAAEAEVRKWAESGAAEMLYSGSSVVFNLQRSHFGDMDFRDVIEDLDVSGEAYGARREGSRKVA